MNGAKSLEAIVAVNNIVSSIRNLGELHKYTGRINCPFEMGSGKAAFVVGTYDKPVKQIHPTRIRHLMKRGSRNSTGELFLETGTGYSTPTSAKPRP